MGRKERQQFADDKRKYYAGIKDKPILCIEVMSMDKPVILLSIENMIVLYLLDTYCIHKLFDIRFILVKKPNNNSFSLEDTVDVMDEDAAVGNSDSHDNLTNCVMYTSDYFFEEEAVTVVNDTKTQDNSLHNNLSQIQNDKVNLESTNCKNPSIYVPEKKLHIAGLAAVLRLCIAFATRNDVVIGETEVLDVKMNNERQFPQIPYNILGHNWNCLAACSEASRWTQFCEHGAINMLCTLRRNTLKLIRETTTTATTTTTKTTAIAASAGTTSIIKPCLIEASDERIPASLLSQQQSSRLLEIPIDLLRFENHLNQPCRVHNFRKNHGQNFRSPPAENNQNQIHEEQEKENDIREKGEKEIVVDEKDTEIKPKSKNAAVKKAPRIVPHDFAEGPDFTLSDLLLFPCIDLALSVLGSELFKKYLPKVYEYHGRLCDSTQFIPIRPKVTFPESIELRAHQRLSSIIKNAHIHCVKIPTGESLYNGDSSKTNTRSKLYTKQDDIDDALRFLSVRGIQALNLDEKMLPSFEWEGLPRLLHPEGGQLPFYRIEKKAQQLSNLVQRVEKVYYEKYEGVTSKKIKIVDFCSGGGHLGILLAYKLPKCEIILVENKHESLRRAEDRITLLGLTNVSFYQCNLDYFTGEFDIGVACHACGVATDLVLTRCVKIQASFVCSPCCYGSIRVNHVLDYPRSTTFTSTLNNSDGKFSLKHYFVLSHSADQTHKDDKKTVQGKMCMRFIDTDRLFYAEENNYQTSMSVMEPPTCSPKNHILVGVPN